MSPELTAILLRGQETKDFDYKAAIAWDEGDKSACCAIVKDILAMANTLGGFIVIGVSEALGGFSWDGVNPDQAKSFDVTRLNRFLQNYADPPINARIRKTTYDGKVFVVIEVPAFPDTPHICQKEYPGVLTAPILYVRTDNNESAPVKSAADFKNVVEKAVRNRSDALLASFRAILTSGSVAPEPSAREKFLTQRQNALTRFAELNPLRGEEPLQGYTDATFFPDSFDVSRFTLPVPRAAAERAHVDYKGWPFLYIHVNTPESTYAIQDGWETFIHTKDFGDDELLDFWRFQQTGLFYQRTCLRPTAMKNRDGSIVPVADLRGVAVYFGEAIDCLFRLYDGLLDDTEYVSAIIAVLNADGRILVNTAGAMPLWNPVHLSNATDHD
jgi:hypothetical protein